MRTESIQKIIQDLMEQRSDILNELLKLDSNNYVKKADLQTDLVSIDNRIDLLLEKL